MKNYITRYGAAYGVACGSFRAFSPLNPQQRYSKWFKIQSSSSTCIASLAVNLYVHPRHLSRSRVEGEHPTGACLDVGGEGEWDRLFVGWPIVINHKEEEFRMYYHALDPDSKTFRVGG